MPNSGGTPPPTSKGGNGRRSPKREEKVHERVDAVMNSPSMVEYQFLQGVAKGAAAQAAAAASAGAASQAGLALQGSVARPPSPPRPSTSGASGSEVRQRNMPLSLAFANLSKVISGPVNAGATRTRTPSPRKASPTRSGGGGARPLSSAGGRGEMPPPAPVVDLTEGDKDEQGRRDPTPKGSSAGGAAERGEREVLSALPQAQGATLPGALLRESQASIGQASPSLSGRAGRVEAPRGEEIPEVSTTGRFMLCRTLGLVCVIMWSFDLRPPSDVDTAGPFCCLLRLR